MPLPAWTLDPSFGSDELVVQDTVRISTYRMLDAASYFAVSDPGVRFNGLLKTE
jgi:hypothetical protein